MAPGIFQGTMWCWRWNQVFHMRRIRYSIQICKLFFSFYARVSSDRKYNCKGWEIILKEICCIYGCVQDSSCDSGAWVPLIWQRSGSRSCWDLVWREGIVLPFQEELVISDGLNLTWKGGAASRDSGDVVWILRADLKLGETVWVSDVLEPEQLFRRLTLALHVADMWLTWIWDLVCPKWSPEPISSDPCVQSLNTTM